MTGYPTATCPVCRQHVGSGLPGSWTPAHHAATLLVHQGVCAAMEASR